MDKISPEINQMAAAMEKLVVTNDSDKSRFLSLDVNSRLWLIHCKNINKVKPFEYELNWLRSSWMPTLDTPMSKIDQLISNSLGGKRALSTANIVAKGLLEANTTAEFETALKTLIGPEAKTLPVVRRDLSGKLFIVKPREEPPVIPSAPIYPNVGEVATDINAAAEANSLIRALGTEAVSYQSTHERDPATGSDWMLCDRIITLCRQILSLSPSETLRCLKSSIHSLERLDGDLKYTDLVTMKYYLSRLLEEAAN